MAGTPDATLHQARGRALDLIAAWADFAERDWHAADGLGSGVAPGGFYGTGYNSWGVQTNQKYLAAMATLAALGGGARREHARDRALAALRFSLASHLSGPGRCADGSQWGHTWISALGIERMMHGVALLDPALSADDRAALRRVLVSEATWLCDSHQRGAQHGVFGDPWNTSGKNAPESNLWNGALLWRTAAMFPELPRAADFRERAHQFLANSVSVPADAESETILAGQPVRARFAGANFFPHYSLDHHGYLNAGYMAICVSNAAILHFDLRAAGLARPETLDHHQADLWALLRRLVFADGRLARIGGDSRVRYAYCQEFLLPSLLYAADRLGDPHALSLADAQLGLAEQEARANGDGSFYGRRLATLARQSPYYFTRLESDRANALSLLAAYSALVQAPPAPRGGNETSFEASVAGAWAEPEHGAALHRSPTRLASFSWRAFGLAQGLCLPPDDGHLAEWERNLAGGLELAHHSYAPANSHHRRLLRHHVEPFPGGFVTSGALMEGTDLELAEGWKGTDSALHQIVFAALPDAHSVVLLQHARIGDHLAFLSAVKGLQWCVPNDLFNHFTRRLATAQGTQQLAAPAPAEEALTLHSAWATVDDRAGVVGLYGAGSLSLHRAPERRAGKLRGLYVEHLCWPLRLGPFSAAPGEVVLDAGALVLASVTAAQTAALAAHNAGAALDTGLPDVRAVRVTACDGRRYVVAANFGAQPASLSPRQLDQPGDTPLTLGPGEARVFQ